MHPGSSNAGNRSARAGTDDASAASGRQFFPVRSRAWERKVLEAIVELASAPAQNDSFDTRYHEPR